MPKNKFFTFCYGVILVLLILWLLSNVQYVFYPFVVAFQTLFVPFIIGGVLFYILRPLVNLMENLNFPRVIAILIGFLVLIGILTAFIFAVGPVIQEQAENLMRSIPLFADMLLEQWEYIQVHQGSFPDYVNEAIEVATDYGQDFLLSIGANIGNWLGSITGFVFSLVIVPFVLFYMLKDGKRFPGVVVSYLSKEYRVEGRKILSDMHHALQTYVLGQIIVCGFVGTMVYIAYLILGLDYSLVLAIFAGFTNLIPYIGPFIGTAPAVVIGLLDSPMTMVYVIVAVVIIQQIESNVVVPQVMGRVLEVHPLTIIVLVLVAGSLFGLLGMLLAVPTYAVAKVVIKHVRRLYRLYQLRHS